MSDRIVFIAENGRMSYRGLSKDLSDSALYVVLADGEVDTITIDASAWLQGSETISSVTRTEDGATFSGASNTTTRAVQNISGVGDGVVRLTTSTGRIKDVFLRSYDRRRIGTPSAA